MKKEWFIDVSNEQLVSLSQCIRMGPIIDEQGQRLLTEELVANVGGLKIQIFANDHPPPHFRVYYAGETANYKISDGSKLIGGLDKWKRNISKWHTENKDLLIKIWNETRPSDCPVGEYVDET